MSDAIMASVILVVSLTLMIRYRAPVQEYDGRTLPNGHTYTFVVGDGLRRYGRWATYYGMRIQLPKQFPHIYLDSRKGGGRKARYIIEASQKVSLEGDFDHYFQLYAAKGSGSLALSIITPDVMETLMSVAGNYDIELYSDYLNIISHKSVLRRTQRQIDMQRIMEALLTRLDLKLKTWPASYQTKNSDRLVLYPRQGVRLFGRYVSIYMIAFNTIWTLATLFWFIGALALLIDGSISMGLLSFLVFVAFLAVLISVNDALTEKFRPW